MVSFLSFASIWECRDWCWRDLLIWVNVCCLLHFSFFPDEWMDGINHSKKNKNEWMEMESLPHWSAFQVQSAHYTSISKYDQQDLRSLSWIAHVNCHPGSIISFCQWRIFKWTVSNVFFHRSGCKDFKVCFGPKSDLNNCNKKAPLSDGTSQVGNVQFIVGSLSKLQQN